MISRIHLILPNAYKLMCFDRNINGNRNVKFLECDKWSLHWYENLTLGYNSMLENLLFTDLIAKTCSNPANLTDLIIIEESKRVN